MATKRTTRAEVHAKATEKSAFAESPTSSVSARANVVCVADVVREHVQWLWHRRVPLGKLGVLDGDPGLGKSTLTLQLAAAATRGQPLPGGGDFSGPCDVVIVSLEDGLADTIRPRLEAAGADLTRVHVITGIGEHNRTPTVPDDLPEIERVITETGARLVVLDPLMAVLSDKVNAHRDQDVRRALAPLAAMAERTGAAVLVVRHFNKGEDKTPINRGGGSVGIGGAARVVLMVARDPEAAGTADDPRRVLGTIKNNLSPEAPSLRWSLVTSTDVPGVAVVAWGESCSLTPAQLLARPEADEEEGGAGAVDEAATWLRERLADGGQRVAELEKAAKADGLSWTSVRRAKQRLKVTAAKGAFKGGWCWALPNGQSMGAFGPHTQNLGAEECVSSTKALKKHEGAHSAGIGETLSTFASSFANGANGAVQVQRSAAHPRGCRCAGDGCASPGATA